MSTEFAIKTKKGYVKIAQRYAGRTNAVVRWLNELAPFLNNNRRVYPLDNTPQGVYTIKDLKNLKDEED